jgi:hypothetical protein
MREAVLLSHQWSGTTTSNYRCGLGIALRLERSRTKCGGGTAEMSNTVTEATGSDGTGLAEPRARFAAQLAAAVIRRIEVPS